MSETISTEIPGPEIVYLPKPKRNFSLAKKIAVVTTVIIGATAVVLYVKSKSDSAQELTVNELELTEIPSTDTPSE